MFALFPQIFSPVLHDTISDSYKKIKRITKLRLTSNSSATTGQTRGVFRTQSNIYDGTFCDNS